MGVLPKIFLILLFSAVFAGCHTPLVDVKVNENACCAEGETLSPQIDGGGCFWPCWCPYGCGATFGDEEGQQAQVIKIEEQQAVGTFLGTNGQTIRLVLPSGSFGNTKEGDKVNIHKKGIDWSVKKYESQFGQRHQKD